MVGKEGRDMIQIADTRYTGALKVGDFIAVAEGNYMYLGFFAGRGTGNSFQYWTLWSLSNWLDDTSKRRTEGKKPWKNYHNSYNTQRALKISPEFLDPEHMELYEKSIEALRILKVLL